MTPDTLTPERLIALISSASLVIIGLWTRFGQSKDTNFQRLEADRARAAAEREAVAIELSECEKSKAEEKDKAATLKQENSFFELERREMLNFIADIQSGYYDDPARLKARAQELERRYRV